MEEENRTLFSSIGQIMRTLEGKRLADVFRFVSFLPMERFGQHAHHRLELNYVKKGSCIIRLENPLTAVPPLEPRSYTVQAPSSPRHSAACCREMLG